MVVVLLTEVALLLGVDAVIDMIRTGVNVLGNCAATAMLGARRSSSPG